MLALIERVIVRVAKDLTKIPNDVMEIIEMIEQCRLLLILLTILNTVDALQRFVRTVLELANLVPYRIAELFMLKQEVSLRQVRQHDNRFFHPLEITICICRTIHVEAHKRHVSITNRREYTLLLKACPVWMRGSHLRKPVLDMLLIELEGLGEDGIVGHGLLVIDFYLCGQPTSIFLESWGFL